MNNDRSITLREVGLLLGVAFITLGLIAIFIEIFNMEHGYLSIVLTMLISLSFFMVDRRIVYARYAKEKAVLMSDLELKDLLYDLMEKTADYENHQDLYQDILRTAIDAMTYGEKGSIIDVRNKAYISYVAVEGFERKVLEGMRLGYKDTYLYKETDGRMDQTVVISNSVNYNQLHSNDDLVTSLIEAGTARIRSTICTPIALRGQVIGMINIDSSKKNAFGDKDIKIIELFAIEVGKIIQYHEILQENLHLSNYDAMTQIYNRSYFYEQHKALYHDEKVGGYIFVSADIDNLKSVNDLYGQRVGDELIKYFARVVKKSLPEKALFGRYGGDEFNIVLAGAKVTDLEEILMDIGVYFQENPMTYEDQKVFVSFSYGIINYPEEEKDYEKLIVKANQRMYAQKKTTKG